MYSEGKDSNANSFGRMFCTVNGKQYDANKWMKHHPGGEMFIKAFEGRDATEAFYTYHMKPFPHQKMSDFCSSNKDILITHQAQKTDKAHQNFFELAEIVKRVVQNEGFAPSFYFIKIFILMILTLCIECNMLYYGKEYILSILLGLCYAWIGLNIQHDANHGAISRNSTINYLLGLTQNYIGGDNLKWIKQHDVQHHIFCNHYEKDPDANGGELIRLHSRATRRIFHLFQCIYIWILLVFYGFVPCFHPSKISTNLQNIALKIFFVMRIFIAPFLLHYGTMDTTKEMTCIFLIFCCCGSYLSFFFIISHHFMGTKHLDDKDMENMSLLQRQVESSSNVGGKILCFFNGGLNYQIEHHLFPRINHCHYPQIAPLVKAYCESKNVKYTHFPTIFDNFSSTVQYFFLLGFETSK